MMIWKMSDSGAGIHWRWDLPRPAKPALPCSYFWTWDHSTNWVLDDPGLQNSGCYNDYYKRPETFVEDYRRLTDLCAGLGIPGIVIWGFLRDSHGGVEYAKRVAEYAAGRNVAIMPGVGTAWYGGVYYEGDHPYRLDRFIAEHPDAVMLDKDGKPYRFNDEAGACPAHPAYKPWIEEAIAWLFSEFRIGGLNIENGDMLVDHNPLARRLRAEWGWPDDDPDEFFFQGLNYKMALDAACPYLSRSLCAYATYTGFNPTEQLKQNKGMGRKPPAMIERLPREAVCQWTLTGMLLDPPLPMSAFLDEGAPEAAFRNEAWPDGLRPPAPRNIGFVHQGSQWHRSSRYACIVGTVKEACLRAHRAGLEGVSIHGEVSARHIPAALNYLAFSHFIYWPEDTLREFGRKTLGPVLGGEAEGEAFIEILARWDGGLITDSDRKAADPSAHGFRRVTWGSRCGSLQEFLKFRFWEWLKTTVARDRAAYRPALALEI